MTLPCTKPENCVAFRKSTKLKLAACMGCDAPFDEVYAATAKLDAIIDDLVGRVDKNTPDAMAQIFRDTVINLTRAELIETGARQDVSAVAFYIQLRCLQIISDLQEGLRKHASK